VPRHRLTAKDVLTLLVMGLALAGALTGPASRADAADVPLAVIVGEASPLTNLSKSALRRAFLSEPTVEAGVKLLPLNQNPGTSERSRFDSAILGLQPDDMPRFWIDQRIRGQGSPPRAIPSVALLGRLLAQLPGAISYVKATEVPAGVKVLTVDGRKPGQPGYALP
jgi:hypothetical protein